MGSSTTFKLLVAAIALTLYWIFFERETAGPAANVGRVFPDLFPEDIVDLEIARTSRPEEVAMGIDFRPIKLRQERSPPSWWILEPIRFEALYPRVQAIAHGLADVVRIAEAPAGSNAFAGGPEVVVRFKTRRGEERVLEIGGEHPDMDLDFSYARLGKEIFVTRKDFRKSFLITLTDMRSRTLLPVPVSDVLGFSVEGDPSFAKKVERVSTSGAWRLREPIDALADRELTEELLLGWHGWTVSDFVRDDALRPEDLAAYGLDKPRAVISVRARDKKTVTLHAGADQGDDKVYLRLAGEPHVFTAPRAPLDEGLKPPEALRSRFLLDLGLEEIDEIRAQSPEAEIVLTRLEIVPRPGGTDPDPRPRHGWRVRETRPGSADQACPGDRELIDGIAGTLGKTLILKFIPGGVPAATLGLDPPRWKLSLKMRTRNTEIGIGTPSDASGDEGLEIYHVSVPGEPGACQVRTDLPALLARGLDAFRDRRVSTLEPASVREIEISVAGSEPWQLARTGPEEPWMLRVDARAPITDVRDLDSARVNQLLGILGGQGFRAIRFLPGITDYAARGIELENPRRAIRIVQVEGPSAGLFRKLVLGDAVTGGVEPEVLARMDLPDLPPFTATEDTSRLFDALVTHLRAVRGR